jgi:uncharacterized RDD family membrane protein YckC
LSPDLALRGSAPLDTVREVPTAEGIELSLRVAGPVVRAYAWVVDLAIRGGIMLAVSIVLGFAGAMGQGVGLLLWFALEWLYPVLFEVYFNGATPGKRAFGLMVMQDDGSPVTFAGSLTRNLLRFADFLPFLYAFGLVAMVCNRDCKRLGDLAAGTLVVYRDKAAVLPALPPAMPLAPPMALDAREARAIVDFAARSTLLAPERAEELALASGPLVEISGRAVPNPAERLIRFAAHLSGKVAPTGPQGAVSSKISPDGSPAAQGNTAPAMAQDFNPFAPSAPSTPAAVSPQPPPQPMAPATSPSSGSPHNPSRVDQQ